MGKKISSHLLMLYLPHMNLFKTFLLTMSAFFLLSGIRPGTVFTCPFRQGLMVLKPMDFNRWMRACFPDYSVTVQGADSCIYGIEGSRIASVFKVGDQYAVIA